jgi:hypothetical protein
MQNSSGNDSSEINLEQWYSLETQGGPTIYLKCHKLNLKLYMFKCKVKNTTEITI